MCLPIVARVLRIEGECAEVELRGEGEHATVSLALCPELTPGAYVLVDRGVVLEVIDEAQAEQILQFYEEMAAMWEEAGIDGAATAGWPAAAPPGWPGEPLPGRPAEAPLGRLLEAMGAPAAGAAEPAEVPASRTAALREAGSA